MFPTHGLEVSQHLVWQTLKKPLDSGVGRILSSHPVHPLIGQSGLRAEQRLGKSPAQNPCSSLARDPVTLFKSPPVLLGFWAPGNTADVGAVGAVRACDSLQGLEG